MRILYIGDIMARPGREVVASVLPGLKKRLNPDIVIAQAENVTHGKGMSPQHFRELKTLGIDVFSGGNHSAERPALHDILNDKTQPVLRPENLAGDQPGRGHYVFDSPAGKVLVISVLGETFPKSFFEENPLHAVERVINDHKDQDIQATVVNFHGEFSSDKRIIGYFLDGRATVVIGDHWHVPTADAMILPGGTAHVTDVGMCGTIHSSLGLEMQEAIDRWVEDRKIKHKIAVGPPYQFNAIYVESDGNGLASKIEHIQQTLDHL